MSFSFELAISREEEIRHGASTPERLASYEQDFQLRATRRSFTRRLGDHVVTIVERLGGVARRVHLGRARPGVAQHGTPASR